MAAGIDNCLAITPEGQAFSWGYSQGGRTGLGTEDEVFLATLIDNTAVKEKRLTIAQCGGQFSILAGPHHGGINGTAKATEPIVDAAPAAADEAVVGQDAMDVDLPEVSQVVNDLPMVNGSAHLEIVSETVVETVSVTLPSGMEIDSIA